MELTSLLYDCKVMHHRISPKKHYFVYKVFMFCVDLDELDVLAKKMLLFGYNQFNLYSFYDYDHLAKNDQTIKKKILDYARKNGVALHNSCKVQLVTLPRVLGYIFNPVSFYFIFSRKGEPICAIAEVSNTFREMKPYILTDFKDGRFQLRIPKYFYVSPFSSLELEFEFDFGLPGGQLDIHIDEYQGEKKILTSSLTGSASPLSNGKLSWYTIKYPLITLKVIMLIHWNAALLYLKGLKYYPKGNNPELQKNLCRTSKTKTSMSIK